MKKSAQKKESFFEKVEENISEAVKESPKNGKFPMKILKNRKIQIGIAILIIIAIGAVVGYQKFINNGESVGGKLSSKQVSDLIAEVGDKMVLPKGETPTIATVTDVTKLEGQPFFKNAVNGDKVMIFGSIKEAILYRPSIHKIISVAPVNGTTDAIPTPVDTKTSQTTPSPSVAAVKLKVVVLNGTKTVGLAKTSADLLDSKNVEVVKTGNSVSDYKITTVSNVSKDKKISDADLASIVSVFSKIKPAVNKLPSGEVAPDGADVVIILGQDFSDAYKK